MKRIYVSTFTLNINESNLPVKRYRLTEVINNRTQLCVAEKKLILL